MMTRPTNPITLTVLWNSLVSIAEEMGTTLRRTAFSEAVREGEDFSTGLFDRQGRLIAQGNFTPGHLGSMPYVAKAVMEYFPPETLAPGDAILLNDSLLGSGHYPDFFLVSPVFLHGAMIGFTVNCVHHVDVGGAAPGSQMVVGVTEAYQEGLRLLPVKLARGGQVDSDILRIILGNVRVPGKVNGDLMAQLNANHIGAERLSKLFTSYGNETVDQAIEEILDRSEGAMRQLIGQIPDGTYTFEDYFDDYGPGTEPVKVHVAVTVAGDEITVDFSGSSDQVPAAMNSYINYTRAYAMFAVKVFTDPKLNQNEGAIRPVHVKARPGSFFNPTYPAPSGGRATVQIRIFEAINGALAQAIPTRAMAAFSHWGNPNIGGIDDRTGKSFVAYDLIMGGYGGRWNKDGPEGLSPVLNAANIPIEVHEAENPILIRRVEMVQDTGGAGQFRGGCALRKEIELQTSQATITLLCDRHRFPPYGLEGGEPGQVARTLLNPHGEARQLSSKGVAQLKKGDVVSIQLAGGGGYGSPMDRDPEAVLADVLDGFVSPGAARERYGVVLSAGSRAIDLQATAALRKARRG